MSGSGPDQVTTPTRTLRRLAHLPAVATTYESRDLALESLHALSEAASQQGYADGYADGLARATAAAARERSEESARVTGALAALSAAVVAVQELEREIRADLPSSVPQLAFAVIEALLAREARVIADPAREAVARALTLDDGTQPATIRLNPADINSLGDVDLTREICVVSDAAVECGGALVEIDSAILDGQLGAALERVKRVLLGTADSGAHDDRAA